MYYLFCPQRRAFWRNNSHGYTSDTKNAAQYSEAEIKARSYPRREDVPNLDHLLNRSRSFAVHVGDRDTLNILATMVPDVPGEIFV